MLDLGPTLPQQAGPAEPDRALDVAATIRAGDVQVSTGPALERLALRGDASAFGANLALSQPVGAASDNGDAAALCLGPDEWLLLAPPGHPAIAALRSFDDARGVTVDVGHRQVALLVTGPRASELLNAGCPLDLHPSSFPPGRCTRTLLGKAEIVLWRLTPERFHVEVARSFVAYVWAFLAEAARGMPGQINPDERMRKPALPSRG